MKIRRTLFLFLISLYPYIFISPAISPAFAADEFSTSYDVIYDAQPSGETSVTQNVTLTNLTRDFYVSEYLLKIGSKDIFGIEAFDSLGPIKAEVERDNRATNIRLYFNEKVVGWGKKLNWTLKYKSKDTAVKNGLVWEVNIPKLASLEGVERYDVKLLVPTSFGPLMYVSPEPIKHQASSIKHQFLFNKEQLKKGGVSAAFGEYQLFKFTLTYHLKNESFLKTALEIALPLDLPSRQQIFYSNLSPKPKNIRVDKDGNYLASYFLSGGKGLEVKLEGFAKVLNRQINPGNGGKIKNLPPYLVELYTKPLPFWESQDLKIKDKAKELVSTENSISENAFLIYEFVTNHLSYSEEKASLESFDRQGAASALENPKEAVCMEFSDLFIALCRAGGIPAREIDGYAVSPDLEQRLSLDVLHSWAEFYDPNLGWVPIDPTWGATSKLDFFTKLDTNHLSFVVKGVSSEEPYPPGAYKSEEGEGKNIMVDFASENYELQTTSFRLDVKAERDKLLTQKVVVENNSSQTAFDVKLSSNNQTLTLGTLPPFSKKEAVFKGKVEKIKINYQDFEGHLQSETILLPKRPLPTSRFLLLTFLALALCVIFCILRFLKLGRKK